MMRLPFLFFLLFVFSSGCVGENSPGLDEIIPESEPVSPISSSEAPPAPESDAIPDGSEAATDSMSPEQAEWNQRVDAALAPVECPDVSPKVVPSEYYSGPLVDTHWHIPSIPDGPVDEDAFGSEMGHPLAGVNVTMGEIACTLKREGTPRVVGFFSVWDEAAPYQLEMVRRTVEEFPGKFVPFIMTPDHDDSPSGFPTVDAIQLESFLDVYPGLFQGYGEIGLYARQGGSAALPPNSIRLKEIYPLVRENNLVVYVHLGEGQQDSFEEVLSENPDIQFIWHGDQLVKWESDNHMNLERLDEILENHPNAYYGVDQLYGNEWLLHPDVSKETFLAHFDEYDALLEEDVKNWKDFIERHPDQVMWGTDRGWSSPWSVDPEVGIRLTDYTRAFIGKLDPSVQERFAHANAAKLFWK
ncbi:MAG: amidohydrolase family protein [archaeon]